MAGTCSVSTAAADRPSQRRHLDVDQGHVGLESTYHLDQLVAVPGLAHHLEVVLEVEEGGQGDAHELLVVGQDEPDQPATSTRRR